MNTKSKASRKRNEMNPNLALAEAKRRWGPTAAIGTGPLGRRVGVFTPCEFADGDPKATCFLKVAGGGDSWEEAFAAAEHHPRFMRRRGPLCGRIVVKDWPGFGFSDSDNHTPGRIVDELALSRGKWAINVKWRDRPYIGEYVINAKERRMLLEMTDSKGSH